MILRTILIFCMLTGPAYALSCKRSDPVIAFGTASASPDVYWVVVGKFIGEPITRIKASPTRGEVKRSFKARFVGHNMNKDGLATPLDIKVIVKESCYSAWCTRYRPKQKLLTFLRMDPEGSPVLDLNLCNSNVFMDPTPEQMNSIKQCFITGCTQN